MVLNIFIILFIIGIAYWQGLQGFFSAFLHLMLVIVSGTLAFAIWEPMAMNMLADLMPRFAWSVGLLAPFVLILLILRIVMDRLVPSNVDFSQLANLIAGGICGAIAAALTVGIFVISLSFLPGGSDNFGYRPYTVNPQTGAVVENSQSKLWLSVDTFAADLFSSLSKGSFAPANGKSLATHQPDLVYRAALNRLRPDPNSSTIATPGAVAVAPDGHHSQELPFNELPPILVENITDPQILARLKDEKQRLVAIELEWSNLNKSYDSDGLRIYPQQVQLITSSKTGPMDPKIHLPFAVSKQTNKTLNEREVSVVNREGVLVMSPSVAAVRLTFLYVIPVGEVEQYILARNLRLPLSAAPAEPQPDKVLAAIGTTLAQGSAAPAGAAAGADTGAVGASAGTSAGVKPTDVEITAELPMNTSRNLATSLTYTDRNEITKGEDTVSRPGIVSKKNEVTRFYVPNQQAMVRVKLSKQIASNYLSHARAAAAALNPVYMTDNEGNEWYPSGYVWHQTQANSMKIAFDTQNPVTRVVQLPIQQMNPADDLYLYFLVKKGIRLDKFMVGTVHTTELNRIEVP